MDQREIETLMEKYRQPAVMVHRIYPPVEMPPVNSHLGGRPSLPTGFDWPRTSSGAPLHFLVQIDCAELPPTDGVLPDKGVLYFFARIDDDMNWGDGDRKDDCRVLFAPTIGSRETDPPTDLRPPYFGLSGPTEDFALPGDPPLNLYPRWPVTFHRINSWPDMTAFAGYWKPSFQYYQRAAELARAAEVVRALGLPINSQLSPSWGRQVGPVNGGGTVTLPTPIKDRPFPQVWVMADRIARYLVKRSIPTRRNSSVKLSFDPSLLSEIEEVAMRWIALAARHGLDEVPDAATAADFARWLTEIAGYNYSVQRDAAGAIKAGMKSAVQYAAASPRAAALIPPLYYNELENEHLPAHASRPGYMAAAKPWDISARYHQMLGNAGSSQEARPVERKEALLLHLKSDYGSISCSAMSAKPSSGSTRTISPRGGSTRSSRRPVADEHYREAALDKKIL